MCHGDRRTRKARSSGATLCSPLLVIQAHLLRSKQRVPDQPHANDTRQSARYEKRPARLLSPDPPSSDRKTEKSNPKHHCSNPLYRRRFRISLPQIRIDTSAAPQRVRPKRIALPLFGLFPHQISPGPHSLAHVGFHAGFIRYFFLPANHQNTGAPIKISTAPPVDSEFHGGPITCVGTNGSFKLLTNV